MNVDHGVGAPEDRRHRPPRSGVPLASGAKRTAFCGLRCLPW